MPEPESVALTCPYCGAGLTITQETVGSPYLTYERPESIECDACSSVHCGATWEPDGTPRDAPGWVRWPDLYSKPDLSATPEVMGGEAIHGTYAASLDKDEFATERREKIIEALSWWEGDEGRWGYDRARDVLDAFTAEAVETAARAASTRPTRTPRRR